MSKLTTNESLTKAQVAAVCALASSDEPREHLVDSNIRNFCFCSMLSLTNEVPDGHRQKIVGIVRAIESTEAEIRAIIGTRGHEVTHGERA